MSEPAQFVQFGNYLLDEEIARGGMARVYRARLRGLGGFEKTLVVKQVLPELASDPRFVEMFVAEAKVVVQMSHPHVVPVYELGVVDGVYFLAMEHVSGATLSEMLRDGALDAAAAAHVGAQVCDALHYAHTRFDLVHRDVTPRNVIVDAAGHARLLDFGIAAPTVDTEGGEVFGSPGYMSPEQMAGDALDGRSDVFSLAATLYESMSGQHAFLRASTELTRAATLEGPLPSFAHLPDVPPELATILDRAMSRDVEARSASAERLGRELRGFLAAHRPEGVTSELGARVERVVSARRRGHRARGLEPREPSRIVRTIATSPVLAAMLEGHEPPAEPAIPDEGTRPVTRPSRDQAPAPADDARGSEEDPDDAGPGTIRIREREPITVEDEPASEDRAPEGAEPVREAQVVERTTPDAPPAGALRRATPLLLALAAGAGTALLLARLAADPSPPRADPSPTPVARVTDEPAPAPRVEPPPEPEPPPDVARPPAPPEPDPEEAMATGAWLTVNATPWAVVKLDGRSLGNTPRRRQPIRAGSHTIELSCPPLGRTVRRTFRASAGRPITVIANLATDPPTVSIR